MSRWAGVVFVLVVVFLAMTFAAANGGNRATLSLGLFTLYRIPVTLVAFSGLLVGMLVMFATGIHSDLKVRKILRDRLAKETLEEQGWIDRNQRDLFAQDSDELPGSSPERSRPVLEPRSAEPEPVLPTDPAPPSSPPQPMVSPAPPPLVSQVDLERGEAPSGPTSHSEGEPKTE